MFARVDGYSNGYWGWGFEDNDLKCRFDAAGIAFQRRKGTYQPLDHEHAGLTVDMKLLPEAKANRQRFETRWMTEVDPVRDGLSTAKFTVLDRRPLPEPPDEQREAAWEMVTVRLG